MTQRKPPSPGPVVEVVRRPLGAPAPAPAPRPLATPSAGPRTGSPVRAGGPPRRAGPRTPRPPPTPEQIVALAKKERVPTRIAKGDLEGKMRAHIWRKLHAEEAKRFTQAYELMEKTANLDLADAFGVIQSGRTVEEFLARKARGQLKSTIKEARSTVSGEMTDAFAQAMAGQKVEMAWVLAERALFDVLVQEGPVAFTLERAGRTEKLRVVLWTRRSTWEQLSPGLVRDPKLAKKPQGVPREPEKRAVADPRPFLPLVGKIVHLDLRNGIALKAPLLAVGPFDLMLGAPGGELVIPLHAMLRWSEAPPG